MIMNDNNEYRNNKKIRLNPIDINPIELLILLLSSTYVWVDHSSVI